MLTDIVTDVYKFCLDLPKIELHAHLNGSLNTKILKQLGCKDSSIEEFIKLNECEKTGNNLKECFKLFNLAQDVTNTKQSVYQATKSVINDFANENVIYLELRTTPRAEESMSKEEYIESVVTAIQDNTTDMIVKLILSIDRRHTPEVSDESLNTIIKLRNRYPQIIVGVDLSGDPIFGSFDEELFVKARSSGLKTTIHCAEVENNEEVEKILRFNPDRLGHATCLHPHFGGIEKNWLLYCEKNIPVEFCLTSNVICGTSNSYREHHIIEWLKHSKPFSLNTDDKGVFCTSLSREYEHAARNYIHNSKDLWKIAYNAVEHAFATDEEKVRLKEKLLNWFNDMDSKQQFPSMWNIEGV